MKYDKWKALLHMAVICLAAVVVLPSVVLAKYGKAADGDASAPANLPERPTVEMFAAKIAMTGPKSTLLSAVLPESFYLHSKSSSWRDISVFDSTGAPVPFAVQSLPFLDVPARPPMPVPFFKWTTEDESFPSSSNIKINARGTVIEVKEKGRTVVTDKEPSKALLLDLTGLPEKPSLIELVLENEPAFNSRVKLSASDDLNLWGYEDTEPIYSYGKGSSQRSKLTLGVPDKSYVLVSPGKSTPPIKEVIARFRASKMPVKRSETIITGTLSEDKKAVIYNIKGHFPISSINFVLKEPDVLNVELRSSEDIDFGDKFKWNLKYMGNIFLLEEKGVPIRNNPLEVRSKASLWRLESPRGFTSVPDMHIFWEPSQVVFVSSGHGPWVLAYGNGGYKYASDEILDKGAIDEAAMGKTGNERVVITPTPAALGPEEYTQRADDKPSPPQEEMDKGKLKNIILWVVLVAAVLVLCALALKLYRGMNKSA